MNTKRLGCLTTSGLIAAALTAILVLTVAFARHNALFSPGELNAQPGQALGGVASHAEIENCSACHPGLSPSDRMDDHCQDCHTGIQAQLSDPSSLHGKIYKDAQPQCRQCHPDHRGKAAALTEITGEFPHEEMGFSLLAHGSLSDLACQDCHSSGSFTKFEPASCVACHNQYDVTFTTSHMLSFGKDCLACHDGIETLGKDFDHASTSFPLTGQHVGLPCTKCHITDRSMADLKSTPQECSACHGKDDPHEGRFGPTCDDCHTSQGWKPAKFDHDLARFKLTGKHIGVECEACHTDGKYTGTPSTCASCHLKDDAHQSQLGTDCGLCHTSDGWLPSTFNHATSAFPLTGAHLEAKCQQCHTDKVFKGTPTSCGSCHAKDDKHNGRFGQDCSLCHSTTAWKPATFDHNLSSFRLTGAHASAACQSCHKNGQFTGTPSACASCHGDPAFHRGMFGGNCGSCHNTSNWSASYSGPHPTFGDEGGINHGGASCRTCHTSNLSTATCTACHDSNNPGDGGGDGGGGDD